MRCNVKYCIEKYEKIGLEEDRKGGTKLYIAICDDNRDELELITSLVNKWQEERQSALRLKSYKNAMELLEDARNERFTHYILDIMMPGITGISAAEEIRSFDTAAEIVFLTASPAFAYESYHVKALDYILKPIREEEIFALLDDAESRERSQKKGITLKTNSSIVRLLFSQLEYVEVNQKHLYFNMSDGQVYEVFGALSDYEEILLSQPEFMQVHRSYIVNMLHVSDFSQSGLKTFTGSEIPISRLRYSELQKKYMELLFNHNA